MFYVILIIENRSSTPPLSQAKGTNKQYFKFDLWNILGDKGHNLILYI